MTTPNDSIPDLKIARAQCGIALLMLAVIPLPLLVAQICVRNDKMLLPARLAEWKRINGQYVDNRFYADSGEQRLLCDVLPDADYSRGGVYFFGSSRMMCTLALWELPVEQQRLIWNYTIPGTTHAQQFQFVRFLVEEQGLLKAGGPRTTVVLELFFGEANHQSTLNQGSIPKLLPYNVQRYGLYSYSLQGGMHSTHLSPVALHMRVAEAHDEAFWDWARLTIVGAPPGSGAVRPMTHPTADQVRASWSQQFVPGWEQGLDEEVDQLGMTVDYLKSRGVNVAVVHLPLRSWLDDLPPSVRYRKRALEMLASKSVPVIDLIHAINDDDFMDSVHLSYQGVRKVRPVLMNLATEHLPSPVGPSSGGG